MAEGQYVYVIDDDDDMRESLVDLLSRRTSWTVSAYSGGQGWLDAEKSKPPGCALLDFSMPGMTGLVVLQRMRQRGSLHQVVMLTGEGNISIAVQAMRNGAIDFIEKPVQFEFLENSITNALGRATSTTPCSSRTLAAQAKIARLKPREMEVMMGLVEGHPNKVIAHELGLSVRTVELHRAALMSRLGADSVADVVKVAYAANLIEP